MPRKIRRITETEIPTDSDEREHIRAAIDPAELTAQEFLSRYGSDSGAVAKVYHETQKGKRYCFQDPLQSITDERIRLYHAAQPWARDEGLYWIKVVVNGEPRGEYPMHIAPQIGTPGTEAGANGSSADGGTQYGVMRLLDKLEEKIERMQNAPREPMSEMVDAMYKLDQMRGTKEVPLDTLLKAVEIGKSIAGAGNVSETGQWLELAKEAMPAVQGLLSALMTNRGVPPVQQLQGGQMPTEADLVQQLKIAIAFLKKKCLAGSHPGLYIELVADNYDEPTYQELVRRVFAQDFSEFASIDPEIAKPPFDAFFRFLYDGLRSRFKPDDPMADVSDGESGNTADTSSNGATGKKRGKQS